MPLTNLEKVRECAEIIDNGIFTEWEATFLGDMAGKLQRPGFVLSPKQQKKIDDLYEKACQSPY